MFDPSKFSTQVAPSVTVGNSEHPIGKHTALKANRLPQKYADATCPIYYLRANDDKFVVTIVPSTKCFAVWDVTYEQFKQLWETQPWKEYPDIFPDVVKFCETDKYIGNTILRELQDCWPELLA